MKMKASNRAVTVSEHGFSSASPARMFRLALLPMLIGSAVPALAQAPAEPAERRYQLEEVVVSASRRQESLQDVASSVQALGAATLDAHGITNFEDLKQAAAGLYLEMPSNSGNASIRLRGVGSAGNSGVDSSVGVLVDGVYQVQPGVAFTELLDVDRVEVLRGPQGTLFGRNTTAGVIHIHTKNPEMNEFSGRLQGVVGNYDAREARGVLNIPLIDDTLAMRISGFKALRDGYTKNIHTGKDTRNTDREGGRVKLLWDASENLEVLWSSEILTTKARLEKGRVEYGNDIILNSQQSPTLAGRPWSELADALGVTLPETSLGRSAENLGAFEDEMQRHVLTLNWSLPGHNLQSITAYEELDSYLLDDRDATMLDLSYLTSEPQRRTKSQEFILSSEDTDRLSYVVGLFYQEEDLKSPTSIYNGADLIALAPSASPGLSNISSTTRSNENRAVFGSVTYDLTDRWTVTGGVRYTSDKKETYSTLDLMNGSVPIVAVDNSKTFNEWTYSAKVQYHIDPAKMVYLSLDRGFKSGGFNRQTVTCGLGFGGCLAADQLIYDPETTDSIEVGLKSEWLDGRVRLNGAIFYQTYDDYQATQQLMSEASTLISNAAEVESTGIEMDLTAALNDHWTLDGSVTWVLTEYDDFENAPCARPDQAGCVNGVLDLSGKRLDNAPKLTGHLGLTYRNTLPNYSELEWFARFDATYQSNANLDVSLAEQTHQGGYALYNARLGIEPYDGRWMATIWGRNLGDKEYRSIGYIDRGGVRGIQGLPRTYGLTVDWFF